MNEFPPLPEPEVGWETDYEDGVMQWDHAFSARQMRDYVAQDRAQRQAEQPCHSQTPESATQTSLSLTGATQAGQEPVEVQYRMAPVWIDAATRWDGVVWGKCSPEAAADYERVKVLHDWEYQVRRLYTAPPAQQPLTDEQISRVIHQSAGYGRDDLLGVARAIEQAHGITSR